MDKVKEFVKKNPVMAVVVAVAVVLFIVTLAVG